MALELVYLFHANQHYPIRYHRFVGKLMNHLKTSGADASEFLHGTVIETFIGYCRDNYIVINEHPKCLYTISQCILSIRNVLLKSRGCIPSQIQYDRLIVDMEAIQNTGLDKIQVQKFIQNCASLKLYISNEYLRYYRPSLKTVMKQLKQPPFELEKQDQVSQLHRVLQYQKPDLLPLQIEALISILSDQSGIPRKTDLLYQHHSPHYPRIDGTTNGGPVYMERICCDTFSTTVANSLRFNQSVKNNHYVPKWVSKIGETSGWALITSTNSQETIEYGGQFLVSLETWRRELLDHGPNSSWTPHYHEILQSGCYVVVDDIEIEICNQFGCTPLELRRRSNINSVDGRSWECFDVRGCTSVYTLTGEGDMGIVPEAMLPKLESFFNVDDKSSRLSLYLHILLNIRAIEKDHWLVEEIMVHRQGFLLLVANPLGTTSCFIPAFIFPDPEEPHTIWATYLNGEGEGSAPFKLSTT